MSASPSIGVAGNTEAPWPGGYLWNNRRALDSSGLRVNARSTKRSSEPPGPTLTAPVSLKRLPYRVTPLGSIRGGGA
jgi:hypothetical protein